MGFLEDQEIIQFKTESERSNRDVEVSRESFARELRGSLGKEMLEELKKEPEKPKEISKFEKIMRRLKRVLS